MTQAMSPRTKRSSTTIRPVLDSWAILRVTLGNPPLIPHLYHHKPQGRLHLVLHPILRTWCSLSLTVLTPSGMRRRSTESSLPKTWRPFALTCVQFWPTRPLFSISSSPFRLNSPSFLSSTSRRCHHRSDTSDHQGSFLHPLLFFYCQWGHWILCLGRVGGDRVFIRSGFY